MQKAHCLLLILSLLCIGNVAGNATPAVAVNQLAFELLREHRRHQPTSNVVFSPVTISSAFAMVYAGAKGQSKAQLEDVFRFEDELFFALKTKADVAGGRTATTNFAAKAFFDDTLQIKSQYANEVGRDRVAQLNFASDPVGAKNAINQFVDEETDGLITEVVDDTANLAATKMAIVSAIFFKGEWKNAFDQNLTKKRGFRSADGVTRMVDFMELKVEERFRFKNADDWSSTMVELPYIGDTFSMFLMLPNDPDGWREVEQNLANVGPHLFEKEHLDNSLFVIEMPKWEMEMEFNGLKSILQDLGLQDVFSSSADLSGISDEHLFLTDVVHKAKIKVDEKGTLGAAATAIFASKSISYVEEFIVDHPFLYFIVDKRDNTILFQGTVTTLS